MKAIQKVHALAAQMVDDSTPIGDGLTYLDVRRLDDLLAPLTHLISAGVTDVLREADQMLWCVHVQGPDTLIAQPDLETALRRAREWQAKLDELAAREPHPYNPTIKCVASVWQGSRHGHAKQLAEHGGEPADIC